MAGLLHSLGAAEGVTQALAALEFRVDNQKAGRVCILRALPRI
jgi:hypothetical protein